MIVRRNEKLSKHTTIGIGGVASNYYIPESTNEVCELVEQLFGKEFKLLGAGSNLLINDRCTFDNVIQLGEFDKSIDIEEDRIRVGASSSLVALINACKAHGLGGIEYLYCVPGTVGGAICMNAGRGRDYHKSISDYILGVDAICIDKKSSEYGVKKYYMNQDCCFAYRDSIFKSGKYLILGAEMKLDRLSPEIITDRIDERKKLVEKVQDRRYPNVGSVFMEWNGKVMEYVQKKNIGFKNGVRYSNKSMNWISNTGQGTFFQAKCIIYFTMLLHFMRRKKCQLEVIIWNH